MNFPSARVAEMLTYLSLGMNIPQPWVKVALSQG